MRKPLHFLYKNLLFSMLIISYLLTFCNEKEKLPNKDDTPKESVDSLKAFKRNENIGTGINLGNALEAPQEGEWGLIIWERYIDSIAQAGFNSVRIPICWSCHTTFENAYEIDEAFLERVAEVIQWCLDRDLTTIITIHHFNDFYEQPNRDYFRNMFFSIWKTLTVKYKNIAYDKLIFEPLNEPHGNMTADDWNDIIPEILAVIRDVDKERTLIIDVPDYGYHESINKLKIPEDEHNIIVSVRYYLPYEFTHQGAHWAQGADEWLGTRWAGTEEQKNTVIKHMKHIQNWAVENNRPITIGEWGTIINCPENDRLVWTNFVRRQIKDHNFSSTYFDFGVLFRIYNLNEEHWIDGFVPALLGE